MQLLFPPWSFPFRLFELSSTKNGQRPRYSPRPPRNRSHLRTEMEKDLSLSSYRPPHLSPYSDGPESLRLPFQLTAIDLQLTPLKVGCSHFRARDGRFGYFIIPKFNRVLGYAISRRSATCYCWSSVHPPFLKPSSS